MATATAAATLPMSHPWPGQTHTHVHTIARHQTEQFLLGNETARKELGRRGRELVSSRHTYSSRVPSILATMDHVLASRAQTSAELGAAAAAAVEEDVPTPEAATVEPDPAFGVAAVGSEVTSAAAAGTPPNRSSIPPAATMATAAAEAAATAAAAAATRTMEATAADPAATDDCLIPGATAASSPLCWSTHSAAPPATVSAAPPAVSAAPATATGVAAAAAVAATIAPRPAVPVRPNAPRALVVFRADRVPSEGWRRSVESAVAAVPGRARAEFLEISPGGAAVGDEGDGLEDGEASRRRALEAHLSRLLLARAKPEGNKRRESNMACGSPKA